MKLQDLKSIWEDTTHRKQPEQSVTPQQIRSLINEKSNLTLAQIKRTMRTKMWVAGISMIVALLLSAGQLFNWFDEPLFFSEILTLTEAGLIFLLMGGIIATVAAGNIWIYRRLTRYEKSSSTLKDRLTGAVEMLKQVMHLGIYSDVIFVPLIAGFIGYRWLYGSEVFAIDIRLGYLTWLIMAFSYISYLLAERLMNKKYGQELAHLQSYLRELNHQQ